MPIRPILSSVLPAVLPAALASALATALALTALPLAALEGARPMTGAEFDAYTRGQTLTFGVDGVPYGIEQYLPGQRVIWSFIGEACREGSWFEAGEQICFEYDDEPGRLHCWTFFDTGNGLRARFGLPQDDGTELVEVQRSPAPMMCEGPMVGA